MTAAAHRAADSRGSVLAWLNLTVAIVLLNIGNLLLDGTAKSAGVSLALFLSPAFIGSITCLGVAFYFYVRSLARLPLAVAYPVMVGISLIIVAAANHYLHQPLAGMQLLGVPLLFGGVVLISTAAHSAHPLTKD